MSGSRTVGGRAVPIAAPSGHADGPTVALPHLMEAWAGMTLLDTVPIDRSDVVDAGRRTMQGRGDRFEAIATWVGEDAPAPHWRVELEVTCIADEPVEAGVRVAIKLEAGDDPDPWIPGLFYGENRPAGSRGTYPRYAARAVGAGDAPDPDPFAADHWGFRADRAATPVVLLQGASASAALATTEVGPLGEQGIGFSAAPDGFELRFDAPYREEPVVYRGGADPGEARTPTHRWSPGERQAVTFRLFVGVAPSSAADRSEILRELHRRGGEGRPPAAPWIDRATAAILAAEGLLRWHHRPEEAAIYETIAFERGPEPRAFVPGDRRAMHVGWLSGIPTAAALLAHGRRVGDDAAVVAATGVMDAIAAHRAPCGTFWGQWTAAHGWGKGWTPGPDALQARTLGEATLFLQRAVAIDAPRGVRHPGWVEAIESNLGFIEGVQAPDGAIPGAWNGTTGEILSWAGTAGLAWVPPLVAAGRLDAAGRAGHHYGPAVEAGRLAGAPEDVDLGPTSEDGYLALMAYVALAEAATGTDRDRWISLARIAADWSLSFRYTYDVAFEADTVLGRIGYRSRGADQASPANQHLHGYGLVCVPDLVRLSRLTGDPHYVERAREHLVAMRQGLARHDGELGARRGMAPERFYQTDYDGRKGDIGPLSHAWCLGLLLWASDAAADLPELADA